MPSIIKSLNWASEPWREEPVGEVYNEPRPFSRPFLIAPPNFNHICGTPEDHAEGGTYEPLKPPVIYAWNGLPLCCFDPFPRAAVGGVGVGGKSSVAHSHTQTSTGGTVAGGKSTFSPDYFKLAQGGTVSGGAAEPVAFNLFCDEYTLDPPLEGRDRLVRVGSGIAVWGPVTPAFLSMFVASNGDGNGDWTLGAGGLGGSIYKPLSTWNGEGCVTFHKVSGPSSILEVEVCCDD